MNSSKYSHFIESIEEAQSYLDGIANGFCRPSRYHKKVCEGILEVYGPDFIASKEHYYSIAVRMIEAANLLTFNN